MTNATKTKNLELPEVITTTIPDMMLMFRGATSNSLNGHLYTTNAVYDQKRGKSYKGYYFDDIIDKSSQIPLTIYIQEKFRSQLKDKQAYEFTGRLYLAKEISYSKLGIMFFITKISASTDLTQLITDGEYSVVKKRYDQGFFDIEADISEKLLRGVKPKIMIFTGASSITEDDYTAALGDPDYFEIIEQKTNLFNKKVFLESIANIPDKIDYFAVVRGGGNGLRFFDDEDLCKQVLSKEVPFITAIGHVADNCMLQRIADKSYDTPTSFGSALQLLVEKDKGTKEEFEILEAKLDQKDRYYRELIEQHFELHQKELKILGQKKNSQMWKLVYVIGLLIIVIILIFSI